MKRILKLENLFAVLLLVSYSLPWAGKIQRFSDEPLIGFEYLLYSIVDIPPVAYILAIIPAFSIAILIKNIKREDTLVLRKILFFLVLGVFLFAVMYHVVAGMIQGKPLMESINYQFSLVLYGVYVALVSAAGLYFVRGRR